MGKLLIALGLLGGLALPMSAQATTSCTPSGDACASVTGDPAGAVLELDSLVPLENPRVCLTASRRPARCLPLELVSRRQGGVTLYSARIRVVPSASVALPAGVYWAQFLARGASIGSPLRLRIGEGPRRSVVAALRLTAPAEVAIGQQVTAIVGGIARATSLRVLLSPLPGGGNCCGVAVAPAARRLGADRVELRFAWPRSYFRCGGSVRCARGAWGRRGRITIVSVPGGDVVAREVEIRRAPAGVRYVAARPGSAHSLWPIP